MSIAPLKKIALIGPLDEKVKILQDLQCWGHLHLTPAHELLPKSDTGGDHADFTLAQMQRLSEKLKKAKHYLQGAARRRFQMSSNIARIDSDELAKLIDTILHNEDERRRLQDAIDNIKEKQAALKSWGDFDFPEGDNIGGQRMWFYLLPLKHKKELVKLQQPWQIIHANQNRLWVVLIAEDEPAVDVLPCERVHTGRESLSQLQNRQIRAEVELEDIEAERQKLTRYLALLDSCQAQAEDLSELARAQNAAEDTSHLFVVYGWVPVKEFPDLQQFCLARSIAVHGQPVTDQDQPPTLLQNPPSLKGGELLVNFYQTPAYRSWDPALPLFVSFSLFFAMILSDAGYSILMLIGVGFFWRTMARSESGKVLRPLLLSLLVLSCIWGVLVGSYFGREPTEGSFLAAVKILDINNFHLMMGLSIVCGILHLLVANIQQVFVNWKTHKAVFHLGWCGVLLSTPLVALYWGQDNLAAHYSFVACCLSAVLIFFGASNRPVHSVKSAILRLLEGLKALTDFTNLFGDILSYLRLFALGLASSSLALTFNNLSDQAFAAEGGFGVITGILIFIVGHALNLFLGVVSGVVHGLRLNFIEFYKWALYGEGYPFCAFKKREY